MQFLIRCSFILMHKIIVILKGILIGGIVGLCVTLWLCVGSLTVRYTYPLPSVSVQQCTPRNVTYTLSTPNLINYTSFDVFDGISARDIWEQTTVHRPAARSKVSLVKNIKIIILRISFGHNKHHYEAILMSKIITFQTCKLWQCCRRNCEFQILCLTKFNVDSHH